LEKKTLGMLLLLLFISIFVKLLTFSKLEKKVEQKKHGNCLVKIIFWGPFSRGWSQLPCDMQVYPTYVYAGSLTFQTSSGHGGFPWSSLWTTTTTQGVDSASKNFPLQEI